MYRFKTASTIHAARRHGSSFATALRQPAVLSSFPQILSPSSQFRHGGASPSPSPHIRQRKQRQRKTTKEKAKERTKEIYNLRVALLFFPILTLSLRPRPAPPLTPSPRIQSDFPPNLGLPQEGQNRQGRSLVPEEHSDGRRSRVLSPSRRSSQVPDLRDPRSTLGKRWCRD